MLIYLLLLISSFEIKASNIKSLYIEAIKEISIENYLAGKNTFIKLLELEPAFYPPRDASPKIKKIFYAAKAIYVKNHAPSVFLNNDIKDGVIEFKALILNTTSKINEVVLRLKTATNGFYMSYKLKKNDEDKNLYTIALPLANGFMYHYYLSVVGEYEHDFLNVYSALEPKIFYFPKKEILLQDSFIPKEGMWNKIFEGWPLILGAGLFVAGALTFSFMKINT
jgi:hypothetical protein